MKFNDSEQGAEEKKGTEADASFPSPSRQKSALRKKIEVTKLQFNTEADLDRFYGRSGGAEFDFEAASAEHGYLKARQMLQHFMLQKEQKVVERVNTSGPVFEMRKRLIAEDRLKLSRTVGLINNESVIDKLVGLARDNRAERATGGQDPLVPKTAEQLRREAQNSDVALHRAMISEDGVLFAAQAGLECLPMGLGDTFSLQTSFLRSLNCHGNQLLYMTSHLVPQLAMNHMRYVKELNLSNNKIKSLPDDIGLLSMLRTVKLAGNILGSLPPSIAKLKQLKELDLSNNTFSKLPVEVGQLDALQALNLSQNAFATVPSCLTKLANLRDLNMNKNYLQHLGILPMVLMKPRELWHRGFDESNPLNPHFIYKNILTQETVVYVEQYDGYGLQNDPQIHVFQYPGTLAYKRRRMWLSACQVQEWEAVTDPATTQLFYQNNVSGEVQWDMPESMDLLGSMAKLEKLELSYNGLRVLPESMSQLTCLKTLTIQYNHIHDLPRKIGHMAALEVLDLQNNDITVLPYSILRCDKLQKLLVMSNALIKLPDLIGTMPNLAKIDVAANRLSTLPFSLGFSKVLKVLHVHDNPLVDPPTAECDKGLPHVMWYMRNRLHIVNRGMPPQMKYHQTGLQDEVTILLPELKEHVQIMIDKGEKTGFLNLQLMNLKYIPYEVLSMKNLKRLRMDCNWALSLRLGVPPELGYLTNLSFKSCKLSLLPDSISNLTEIHTLGLQDNRLEYLPPSFTQLTTLVHLDLSKNRLFDLPVDLGRLDALEYLDVEDNYLEVLPSSIRLLQALKYLNCARNRLIDVPLELCLLKNLRKLNLERNKLIRLPDLIGFMNKLTDVRVGYNRLEYLAEDLFANPEGLIKSLRHFNCSENNLPELPNSICMLDPELRLEADSNPLLSPPPELLTGGLIGVQEYLRVRMVRQRELCDLVTELEFEYVMERTHPVAQDVLEDGLGFLTPHDCAGFDKAVNEFLNGEYYRCPSSANEIASRLAKLREQREEETYLLILKTFFMVIGKCRLDKSNAFGPAVLMMVERPWGRNNEKTDCWALSLHCLLRDNPPNKYQPKGRASVFSMLEKAMPPMPWPFTVELFKDALRLYTTPYGQIADTEPVKFTLCDCIDEEGEPLNHFLPCEKPAVVLCMSLYTEEEVTRQDTEEADLFDIFWELEMDLCSWLLTPEGSRELALETTRRKSQLMTDMRVREHIQTAEVVKLKEVRKEQKEEMKKVDMYNDREPVYIHGIYSDEQVWMVDD